MAVSKYNTIDFSSAIEKVRENLTSHKPQKLEADDFIPAAVMILFLDKSTVPYLLFTKRTELVETHKGQVSFPGGVKDNQDKTLLNTALRETHEEIGIHQDQIEVIDRLDDFLTVTDFRIVPFTGILYPPVYFSINEHEVAEVIQVPLSHFLEDEQFEVKKWDYKGMKYDVYFYYYKNHVIWGATAFILNRFIDQVFGFNPAPNPVREDPRNTHYLKENRDRRGTKDR